jgi:cytochrome c551/c552
MIRPAFVGLVAGALVLGSSVASAQGGMRVDPNLASRGKVVYERNGCYVCHGIGRLLAGPDLAGVTERRETGWLRRWLKETNAMIDTDPQAKAMVEQFRGIKMPQIKLSDSDVDAILHYIAQETQKLRSAS